MPPVTAKSKENQSSLGSVVFLSSQTILLIVVVKEQVDVEHEEGATTDTVVVHVPSTSSVSVKLWSPSLIK